MVASAAPMDAYDGRDTFKVRHEVDKVEARARATHPREGRFAAWVHDACFTLLGTLRPTALIKRRSTHVRATIEKRLFFLSCAHGVWPTTWDRLYHLLVCRRSVGNTATTTASLTYGHHECRLTGQGLATRICPLAAIKTLPLGGGGGVEIRLSSWNQLQRNCRARCRA